MVTGDNILCQDFMFVGGGVILAGAPLIELILHLKACAPARSQAGGCSVSYTLRVDAPAMGTAFVMIQEGLLSIQRSTRLESMPARPRCRRPDKQGADG